MKAIFLVAALLTADTAFAECKKGCPMMIVVPACKPRTGEILDLIERDLVAGAVIKLGCPRAFVRGHGLSVFEGFRRLPDRR